jgi:hypothetical protein
MVWGVAAGVRGCTHLQRTPPAPQARVAVHACGSGVLGLGRQADSDAAEDVDDDCADRVRWRSSRARCRFMFGNFRALAAQAVSEG